jgi:hypothetical protein
MTKKKRLLTKNEIRALLISGVNTKKKDKKDKKRHE